MSGNDPEWDAFEYKGGKRKRKEVSKVIFVQTVALKNVQTAVLATLGTGERIYDWLEEKLDEVETNTKSFLSEGVNAGDHVVTDLGVLKYNRSGIIEFKLHYSDQFLEMQRRFTRAGVPFDTELKTESNNPAKIKLIHSDHLALRLTYLIRKKAENSLTEDCLFLNIYVPDQEPDKETGHAVMVFIHGGGFSLGTGNRFIGDRLASVGNVIVVTINYRLWIWGFLDFNDERAPGNMGLWDQQMALKWVNKNIESFGGDKDRVTIFGQSAGAISVGLHALYPKNEGLFQNVIAESGSPTVMSLVKNIDENIQPAAYLAQLLNCSTENNDQVFECIQKSDSDSMIKAFKNALTDPRFFWNVIFTPTLDGEFVKSSPSRLVEQAKTGAPAEVEFFRSLSFINGLNGDEGGMWIQMIDGTNKRYDDLKLSQDGFDDKVIPLVTASDGKGSYVLKSLISSKYKDWKTPYEPKNIGKQAIKLLGDIYINVPGIEFGRLHANDTKSGSYLYRFTAGVERHLIPTPSWIGSGNHADEIGPVFGYHLDYDWFDGIKGDYSPPEWEWNLSERMMTFWTNFAKYSNPNGQDGSNSWPKYTIDHEHYLNFDRRDYVGQYLHADEVEFWRNIVPMVEEKCHDAESSAFSRKSFDTCDAEGGCD
ncbi:cholinesterase 1-like [Mercenaria mercenaria]|uniref:cholinesterase 1-like n=1 Tax=Mercenaria mercenaria TaxID=6596 RepID=UPI00234F6DCD|nr:cholinesterase 1-like [Mercenaria mercenaria]